MEQINIKVLLVCVVIGAIAMFIIPKLADMYVDFKLKKYPDHKVYDINLTMYKVAYFLSSAVVSYFMILSSSIVECIFVIGFTICALVSIEVDNRVRLIGNEMVLGILLAGIVYRAVLGGFPFLVNSFLTMLGVGVFLILSFYLIKPFMATIVPAGAGDFKAMLAIAFVLGYPDIVLAMMTTCIVMLVYIIVGMLRKKIALTSYIPMAGFIMTGFIVGLLNLGIDVAALTERMFG